MGNNPQIFSEINFFWEGGEGFDKYIECSYVVFPQYDSLVLLDGHVLKRLFIHFAVLRKNAA